MKKNKEYSGIRVLVLEGYARQSLPLIKAFNQLRCEVTALCSSKLDVAYASRYAHHKIIGVCNRELIQETTQQVRELLETGCYDVVVPTADFSAALLSENKTLFSRFVKVASNDWEIYKIAGDKLRTMQVCMENQIPCPFTLLNTAQISDVISSGIRYPIVVKPRIGYGAIGFKVVNSCEELKRLFSEYPKHIKDYVFQEYIPQTGLQYECAMFMDDHNEPKTTLAFSKNRWFPIEGGSSTLNITVDRPDIVASCTKLLQAINWRGAADIDLIQDPRDGKAKIMEVNPRVSGSVKICFDAGVDQARQMLELAYVEPVTEYKKYELGRRLRCSQTDFLWFLKSPNRWRSKPSWFSCYKTHDQIFSLTDPLPWFAFSIHGVLNFKKEMKKRL